METYKCTKCNLEEIRFEYLQQFKEVELKIKLEGNKP